MKLEPGSINLQVSDQPIGWIANHRGDPIMASDPASWRDATPVEIAEYIAECASRAAEYDD